MRKNTLLPVTPTMTCSLEQRLTRSLTVSDIFSEILPGMYSGCLPGIFADILRVTYSDGFAWHFLPCIDLHSLFRIVLTLDLTCPLPFCMSYSDILFYIFWHVAHVPWQIPWRFTWHWYSKILPGLCHIWSLALAYIPTFYQTYRRPSRGRRGATKCGADCCEVGITLRWSDSHQLTAVIGFHT